jgi:ribosomal protein S18 acetylase RimI-like enzyme
MLTSIRLATSKDVEELLHLMRQMQEDDPWSEVFDESVVRFSVLKLLQDPMYGVAYLAQDGEVLVGYVAICFDYSLEYGGKGAWIDELFVARSHRQRGIGAQLLEIAESASAEHHAKYLHLEVTPGNPAIELYRRHGFVDHQRYLMTKRIGK